MMQKRGNPYCGAMATWVLPNRIIEGSLRMFEDRDGPSSGRDNLLAKIYRTYDTRPTSKDNDGS